jgi:hypothetical protein
MGRGLTRRDFLGAALAAASLPVCKPAYAQDVEPEKRLVFDAISGEPLEKVQVTAKKVGDRGRWVFKTDADGIYPFGEICSEIEEPTLIRLKISSKKLSAAYIGLESYLMVYPDQQENDGFGDVGLIPLKHPAISLSVDDTLFNERWLALLKEVFFSVDRQGSPRPRRTAIGALARFSPGEMRVYLSTAFSAKEVEFITDVVGGGVAALSAGTMSVRAFRKFSKAEPIPSEGELTPGTITIIKNLNYPRPAVRIRYGNTPSTEGTGETDGVEACPHEILAALIILDTLTLEELFQNGLGDQSQQAYARSIIQRCIAYSLGWRPTMLLPNRTMVDDSYGPPETIMRRQITAEDRALALAAAGGGSGCYPAGTRFLKKGVPILKTDPSYPLNRRFEENEE